MVSPVDIWPPLSRATTTQWALLVLIGAMGTVGHLFLILALGVAPMSVLMPFTYTQIACAMGVSWLVFRHVPDGFALLGMAVIAACGAASVWLNVREAAARRAPDSVVSADAAVGD